MKGIYILGIFSILVIGLIANRFCYDQMFAAYLKPLQVKEALDIQESRQREQKLAEYCQTIDYQIEVLTQTLKEQK